MCRVIRVCLDLIIMLVTRARMVNTAIGFIIDFFLVTNVFMSIMDMIGIRGIIVVLVIIALHAGIVLIAIVVMFVFSC